MFFVLRVSLLVNVPLLSPLFIQTTASFSSSMFIECMKHIVRSASFEALEQSNDVASNSLVLKTHIENSKKTGVNQSR